MNFLQTFFLTLFFSGKIKKAPGTWGSIFSFFLALSILNIFGLIYSKIIFLVLIIFITIISIPIINNYEKKTGIHDNSEIVIDELIGLFISIFIIIFFSIDFFWIFLGLVFFRIFDIWKPSYIGKVDKNVKGGLGVMLDDILAGIMAGFSVIFIFQIYKLFLG